MLAGQRKKIAKFLMRTFTCRSTFLCVLTPVCNVGGWVRLMLTADHGHPRTAHRQPQVPHCSSGLMRLTVTYFTCALCSEHAPYSYLLRMRGWVCLMLTADHGHPRVSPPAPDLTSLLRVHAPYCHLLRMRVMFRACALLSLLAHTFYV